MKAMHMEQKYQLADNFINFNYLLKFKLGPEDVRAKGAFSTIFESTMLDWDLQLHKQFAGHILHSRESNWVISLNGSGVRDSYPPLHKLYFKVKAMGSDGSIKKSLKYFIDGLPIAPAERRGRMDHRSYTTLQNTQFERDLSTLIAEAKKKAQTIQLETRLEFKKNDLVDMKYLLGNGAPNMPDSLDYYFDAITNKSRHDLKLKTSDGMHFVMTNKEIVCLASQFFRQHLKDTTTEYTVGRADSVQSIDICLTYMITGIYKKPALLSPKLAFEIFALAMQWKVFEPKVLKNSIEKHCCEELQKNYEDIMYVCNMLIIADDAQFANVQNCCIATLVFYHAHDFIRIFVIGNHPLKERFSRRQEFLRPSLTMQVKRAFAASNESKCFIKFLPAIGED
ncbi:BTB domain-containing protein [Caenorhabditis elegans]|uniref:BTB domain-containing protein n=1 Tax=Caenorhabditis elegans TaxID=6239 RepID=Q18173_CAEEL|nr:BTB domain-containing protein [Caenorhabditis elegans]CAA94574.2 BTB domain-containing protein [Caenorhabditis elegans]|eukprot:NP_502382.2 Uncharacterized protein CELE_C25G4.8 [Caenorhabditis elegans]